MNYIQLQIISLCTYLDIRNIAFFCWYLVLMGDAHSLMFRQLQFGCKNHCFVLFCFVCAGTMLFSCSYLFFQRTKKELNNKTEITNNKTQTKIMWREKGSVLNLDYTSLIQILKPLMITVSIWIEPYRADFLSFLQPPVHLVPTLLLYRIIGYIDSQPRYTHDSQHSCISIIEKARSTPFSFKRGYDKMFPAS